MDYVGYPQIQPPTDIGNLKITHTVLKLQKTLKDSTRMHPENQRSYGMKPLSD